MKRIVIHRDRTFTHDGHQFQIHEGGTGWGFHVTHDGMIVHDCYWSLADIRYDFPDDYASWKDRHEGVRRA